MNLISIIKEEIQKLCETAELMGIPELAEYMSRISPEHYTVEDMTNLLNNEYQDGGDEAVKKFFKDMTTVNIDDVGRGKYVFKY